MKWSFKKVTAMIAILVVLAGGIFLAAYLKEVADYKRSVREIAIEEICLSDIPDGEYIGECNVDFIYAKVEVTVHSGRISNIRILEHKNERGQAAEVIIDKIVSELVDDNLKRRFIAGLADTIGSTRSTHRRFSDDKQMVSFEISGFEYHFVCSLCKLLHSIGCYPDQILWNHPNFHCGNNPYDQKWKKGFKLRVYLDQYEKFGAFAFVSKAVSAKENQSLESVRNVGIPCVDREIKMPSMACVHCDENSELLPDEIRGGHYLHNRHVCAVLGCEHAPYEEIKKMLANAEYCINPFPILVKGKLNEIEESLRASKGIFLRIHQSFLINYKHIKGLAYDFVVMDNEKRLSISEDRRKLIGEQYCAMEDTFYVGM